MALSDHPAIARSTTRPVDVAGAGESAPPGTADRQRTLQAALDRLAAGGVAHCLLRDPRSLGARLDAGADVDLVIDPRVSTLDIVRLLADLSPAHVDDRAISTGIYLPAGTGFLCIDCLRRDRAWLGAPYLRSRDLLAQAWREGGPPVASLPHRAIDAWLGSVLWQGAFKDRYRPLIDEAFATDPGAIRACLADAFGTGMGDRLARLVETGDPARSARIAPAVRRALWGRRLRHEPVHTLAGLWTLLTAQARLRMRPPGLFVVLLGPDGIGKSAVAELLARREATTLPFTEVVAEHVYRPVLPKPADLLRGRWKRPAGPPPVVAAPHAGSIHGPLIAVPKMMYYLMDEWLSEARWGRHQLARNVLRVHDRHYLEIEVDPARYRYGGPRWFARLIRRASPQPDLVILLDAPPEVVQTRKAEVPLEETRRQREAYRRLVSRLPATATVDASRPLDDVVLEVRAAILRFLADRTRRRFPSAVESRDAS